MDLRTKSLTRLINGTGLAVLISLLVSCGSDAPTFSLTSVEDSFQQNSDQQQISKVDILWVIDNSGSMKASQDNVAANFDSFISEFTQKNLDYQIAVTATDAYKANTSYFPSGTSAFSRFRTGNGVNTDSGVHIITPTTLDINNTFLTNVSLGIGGTGDERAFSSLQETLNNAENNGLIRPNSFLAVIIVSDENDFSRDQPLGGSNAVLHEVSDYVTYLDGITGSTADKRRYNVSSIHIQSGDTACMQQQEDAVAGNQGQKYGARYEELVQATGGDSISLCSDFGVTLETLSENIIEASLIEQFTLNREPLVNTIVVTVNGVSIPMSGTNGWEYSHPAPGEYYITFNGSAVPPSGAQVNITFDPAAFVE